MEDVQIVPNDENEGRRTVPGRNGGTLTPYNPGESGNSKGKPPGTRNLSTILRRMLDEDVTVNMNGQSFVITRGEALMLEKLRLATNSPFDAVRLAAIKDIEDRLEGKPIQSLPPSSDNADGAVVFYIPNQHSRKRKSD